ncbi:hypothetical protein BDF21DRAFT_103206 [Thamnidium elegans]|nr:hypothetical protein BDF21DRAFT_103206 [Thamnidium elegans]
MQLKFVPLGLIASMLASVSARSLYSENSLSSPEVFRNAPGAHLVARCSSGCCDDSCGGGGHGDHGDGDFDFGDFGNTGTIFDNNLN